ncbi:MAG: YhjD/YihY/BrkB family envelope integrity protein [Caldilineaceae bacterium]
MLKPSGESRPQYSGQCEHATAEYLRHRVEPFRTLFGATAVFSELRTTLNFIWDVPWKNQGGILELIRDRLLALLMVIGSGFVLLSSLLLNILLSVAADWLQLLPIGWIGLGQMPALSFHPDNPALCTNL